MVVRPFYPASACRWRIRRGRSHPINAYGVVTIWHGGLTTNVARNRFMVGLNVPGLAAVHRGLRATKSVGSEYYLLAVLI